MLALDDSGIARLLIAATRFERDAERTALLRKFAYIAERRPPAIARSGSSENRKTRTLSTETRHSAAAIKMRRHRERGRRGEAVYRVPIGPEVVDLLVRAGWLPAGREVYSDLEVAEAAGAILRDTARRN